MSQHKESGKSAAFPAIAGLVCFVLGAVLILVGVVRESQITMGVGALMVIFGGGLGALLGDKWSIEMLNQGGKDARKAWENRKHEDW